MIYSVDFSVNTPLGIFFFALLFASLIGNQALDSSLALLKPSPAGEGFAHDENPPPPGDGFEHVTDAEKKRLGHYRFALVCCPCEVLCWKGCGCE